MAFRCLPLASMVLLAGCSYAEPLDPNSEVPPDRVADIRIIKGNLPLPLEAANVYYADWAGMDTTQIIRFDLPAGRAERIMTELTGLPIIDLPAIDLGRLERADMGDFDWWDLDDLREGRGGSFSNCWPLLFLLEEQGPSTRVYLKSSTC